MIAEMADNWTTVWSKRGALVLLGWFLSSAYHGTMTLDQKAQTLDVVQRQQIPALKAKVAELPALKAQVKCEHQRASISASVATQAIKGALVDSAPIPSPSAIPADNCPRPAAK